MNSLTFNLATGAIFGALLIFSSFGCQRSNEFYLINNQYVKSIYERGDDSESISTKKSASVAAKFILDRYGVWKKPSKIIHKNEHVVLCYFSKIKNHDIVVEIDRRSYSAHHLNHNTLERVEVLKKLR